MKQEAEEDAAVQVGYIYLFIYTFTLVIVDDFFLEKRTGKFLPSSALQLSDVKRGKS